MAALKNTKEIARIQGWSAFGVITVGVEFTERGAQVVFARRGSR